MSKSDEVTCINLLKAMELGMEETEVEEDYILMEQETINLPEEWIYSCGGFYYGIEFSDYISARNIFNIR